MTAKANDMLGDKNRRRFFRHACDVSLKGTFEYDRSNKWSRDIRLGYLKSDMLPQSHLRVLNISQGGIALVSQYPAAKDTIVSLKITTAFDTIIRAKARVAWSKRLKKSTEAYAIGLEFEEMSRGDTRNLKELLRIFQHTRSGEKSLS